MTTRKLYILILASAMLIFTDCGRPRRRDANITNSSTRTEQNYTREGQSSVSRKSVVKMRNQSGVYYVPCKINDIEMSFIFDTGASNITMSLTEALFLYKQGKLTDNDFTGSQQYQIADGSIHEGALVNLRTVQIGNRTLHNIQASIIDNLEAPLLLGQSALSEFGKVSIDYTRKEITFE